MNVLSWLEDSNPDPRLLLLSSKRRRSDDHNLENEEEDDDYIRRREEGLSFGQFRIGRAALYHAFLGFPRLSAW